MTDAWLTQTSNPADPLQTHQFFGFVQRVLHIGEAEARHRDELAHHRHKLVSQLLWQLLLILQLLEQTGEGLAGARRVAEPGVRQTHALDALQAAAQVSDVFLQFGHTADKQPRHQ